MMPVEVAAHLLPDPLGQLFATDGDKQKEPQGVRHHTRNHQEHPADPEQKIVEQFLCGQSPVLQLRFDQRPQRKILDRKSVV